MKIFDLTRGKYPQLYFPAVSYDSDLEYVIHGCSRFVTMFQPPRTDIKSILSGVPIFLVESSMANEFVAVPGCECSVLVPKDKYLSHVGKEFDIDDWVKSKEKEMSDKKDDPRERIQLNSTICDMLGVYVSLHENNPMARRIFIWMDKIVDYAIKNTKNKVDINDNALALFELVLYHEIGHALMDVELYGIHPSPFFSYGKDYIYRFIEEAYANGIALSIVLNNPFKKKQQGFIEDFVKIQGPGYSDGLHLGLQHCVHIDQWMAVKVLFNYEFALMLRETWKSHHCIPLENCVEIVGRAGWLAVKDHNCKWGIMELVTHKMVNGFKKYDSFWSFDKNGLCLVRLDKPNGYLYGYVNEQGVEKIPVKYDNIYSFENGITVAKLNGVYGIIDVNNHIIASFNLNYLDMRGLRNGYATMKDYSNKWGAIDAKGNVVVPCQYDSLVIFDTQGVAEVKKDGEEFKIDISGNRVE